MQLLQWLFILGLSSCSSNIEDVGGSKRTSHHSFRKHSKSEGDGSLDKREAQEYESTVGDSYKSYQVGDEEEGTYQSFRVARDYGSEWGSRGYDYYDMEDRDYMRQQGEDENRDYFNLQGDSLSEQQRKNKLMIIVLDG